ncbi:MAG: hypothetical protein QOI50_1804 [Pseudonocardiales bacterium]|jgi:uncharacterized protein YbjT (DUF2867 family)|nr:hypothetical protein [Pseudonocardiales bacterium]
MILITGATGNVGRAAVELLLARGHKVLAVSRDPAAAALPADAEVVAGDPSRPRALAPALAGVRAILLSPRAVGEGTAELLALAAERGVTQVVVLSALTVEHGGGDRRFADGFRAVEDAARASGLAWTFLRCADFAANALAWAPQVRSTGQVRGAYGAAATSTVHERDVAEVGVRALLEPGHGGCCYELTGPQSLTQRAKVRLIGDAIGVDVDWVETEPEQLRRAMLAQGVPPDVPDRLLGYLADHVTRPGPSSTAVAQLLGRPARTFAGWAAEHAAAFRH